MKLVRWIFSYLLVSVVALGGAFYLASAVMAQGQAQESGPPKTLAVPQNPVPVKNSPPAVEAQLNAQPSAVPVNNANVPAALLQDTGAPAPLVQQTGDTLESSEYDMTGVRDPFRPYRNFKPVNNKTLGKGATNYNGSDPLQNLELTAIEVVAVLWDVKEPRAMIRTPTGTIHTIKRNTKIGRNNGFVTGIREGEVIVVENFEEDGKIFKQFSSLKMVGPGANNKSNSASSL